MKLSYGHIFGIWFLLLLFPFRFSGQNRTEVLNKGIPGNSSAQLLDRVGKDVIAENPDLVIVLVGTNDLLNTAKMTLVEKYRQQLGSLADTLIGHHIRVVLVSPPTVDSVYLFRRHDPGKFDMPPARKLELGRDAVREVCRERGLLFVDLHSFLQNLDIPRHNADEIIRNENNSGSADGVHFTRKGNELLARYIYCHLLACYDIQAFSKIACFGDSITNSVYMEGAGTSEGDTYPGVLSRLINQ